MKTPNEIESALGEARSAGKQTVLLRLRSGEAMRFVTRLHQRLAAGIPIVIAFRDTQRELLHASRSGSELSWAGFELTTRTNG